MQNRLLHISFCLILVSLATPSHADTLDDNSIRSFYAEATASIKDGTKIIQIMKDRFDDGFILTTQITQTIGNNPSSSSNARYNKKETLANTAKGYSLMEIGDYQNNTHSITYSADKKTATVQDETKSTGNLNIPGPGGEIIAAIYIENEKCTDTLALVASHIKLMRSNCMDNLVIKKAGS